MADRKRGGRGKPELTSDERKALLARALAARTTAYAPYSNYHVGAAALTADGTTYVGCNIENASYPLCLCAERTALGSAIAAGEREIVAMAIATESSPPASPCGACRQVMMELAPHAVVLLTNDKQEVEETTVAALLPRAFTPQVLAQPNNHARPRSGRVRAQP